LRGKTEATGLSGDRKAAFVEAAFSWGSDRMWWVLKIAEFIQLSQENKQPEQTLKLPVSVPPTNGKAKPPDPQIRKANSSCSLSKPR
jgi:beta-glucanase (GH16 family)